MADKWRENPGHQPPASKGKRVRVKLAHGREGSYDPNEMSPPGWAADTTRWSFTDSVYDVTHYIIL